jgi:DNA-binding NtrC family response regulator
VRQISDERIEVAMNLEFHNAYLKEEVETAFPIELPLLRARKDDIPLLAAHFVAQASKKHGVPSLRLTKEAGERLQQYEWPGNIRELQNVIERAVILSKR